MHPPIQAALSKDSNPLAALLFAGVRDALAQSNWLAMGLKVQGDSLALEASVDGKTSREGAAEFTLPSGPDDGALPNLSVPRSLAALSFYRDLHGFYAAKDKLFPERTSGLIFFENMMGIFFSGRDLTDEVLAAGQARDSRRRCGPEVRCRHRHAADSGAGLRRDHPGAQSQAVWRSHRGGLAEGRWPGELHARPEGPGRV